MPDWQRVTTSKRIVAEAYLVESETILVRFPSGVEYYYRNCSPSVWHAFTAPGQSRGKYIDTVLNRHPKGYWRA